MVGLAKVPVYSIVILFGLWLFISSKQKSNLETKPQFKYSVPSISKEKEYLLAYPQPPPGTYCSNWNPSFKKAFWSDSKGQKPIPLMKGLGWNKLESKPSGRALKFKQNSLQWTEVNAKTSDRESNERLFLVPEDASLIYTKRYFYSTPEKTNKQTARIGIDYACPNQMLNHIPGASAYCRKDYLQRYLMDYQKRYKALDLSHCYQESLTPDSYILSEPEHCIAFIDQLKQMVRTYDSQNFPLNWILKSAVQHKGSGIKLVDYDLAVHYLKLYTRNTNCYNLLPEDSQLIAQKYIGNPALIEGRKFDFRVFVAVINSDPLVALWSPESGHSRVSDQIFNKTSKDFTTHITADVKGDPEVTEFLLRHRFNLKELALYFQDQIQDVDKWLNEVAYPQIKSILIHMFRATQQNFLVKRPGFMEFYGVDFILEDNMEKIYLLESNRRPNVYEKKKELRYRQNNLLYDMHLVTEYLLSKEVSELDPEDLYWRLSSFEPLIDETKPDPYFGMLSHECSVPFKDFNTELPVDPMMEPLWNYVNELNS